MTIEYLKGADNKIADILSWVPQRLDPEAVTVLLNHTQRLAMFPGQRQTTHR